MSKLDELQDEFMRKHQDADLIVCYPAPPEGSGKVIRAVYYSPAFKADTSIIEFFHAVRAEEERRATGAPEEK